VRQAGEMAQRAQGLLQPHVLGATLGCPGETVIGNDREIEEGPALSLWLGRWSGQGQGRVAPVHLYLEQTSEGLALLGWPDALAGPDPAQAVVLLLADPYTFPADAFLQTINDDYPGLRVLGGMASGTDAPGACRMIYGEGQVDQGAVGVLLEGPLLVRPVVSQ